MSKEKQALERLKGTLLAESYDQDVLQDAAIIESALTILEILKNKPWLLSEITDAKDYQTYQSWCSVFRADINYRATENEFSLIKSWLTQK